MRPITLIAFALFLVLAAPLAVAQQAHRVYLPQVLRDQPRAAFWVCPAVDGLECIQGYPGP